MLDMGFIKDIRRIIDLLPPRRQNLLFSATFSDEIRRLAAGLLHDPAHVQIAKRNEPIEAVRQVAIRVNREEKRDVLRELWASKRLDQALVFVRTKHFAGRLADQLVRDGIKPRRSTATGPSRSASARSRTSRRAGSRSSSPRTSRRAASTSRACRMSSTTSCRSSPRTTSTASAAPAEQASMATRSRSSGPDEVPLLHEIEALIGREIPMAILPGFEPGWHMPEGSTAGRRPPGPGGRSATGPRRRSSLARARLVGGPAPTSPPRRWVRWPQHRPRTPAPASAGHHLRAMPGERFAKRGPAGA